MNFWIFIVFILIKFKYNKQFVFLFFDNLFNFVLIYNRFYCSDIFRVDITTSTNIFGTQIDPLCYISIFKPNWIVNIGNISILYFKVIIVYNLYEFRIRRLIWLDFKALNGLLVFIFIPNIVFIVWINYKRSRNILFWNRS